MEWAIEFWKLGVREQGDYDFGSRGCYFRWLMLGNISCGNPQISIERPIGTAIVVVMICVEIISGRGLRNRTAVLERAWLNSYRHSPRGGLFTAQRVIHQTKELQPCESSRTPLECCFD